MITDVNGDTQTVSTTVNPDGTYSVDVVTPLANGTYTAQATVSDKAGNSATATDPGSIKATVTTIDVVAPDNTNDNTPTISGTTDAPSNSIVTITVTASGLAFGIDICAHLAALDNGLDTIAIS